MRKYLRLLSPLVAVLFNIVLAYISYFIARMVFLAENYGSFSEGLTFPHLMEMFCGGMMFDTTAILYTNALYVVMMLFPFHKKENNTYHNVCRGVFVAVNGLAFAINMCDAVYFQYTFRRTTTTVFNEFGNENNIASIMGREVVSHWYLFLVTVAVAYGLFRFYKKPYSKSKKKIKNGHGAGISSENLTSTAAISAAHSKTETPVNAVHYALAMVLSLVAFAPFCVAGMRGGWTRDTRPITISNANNFCNRSTETALVLNTPFALIRTIGKNKFSVPEYYSDRTEMANIFNPVRKPVPSRPFRKKNVVVIIIESFGREYIGAYNNGLDGRKYKGYTTFLDSLIHHSLTFRYSYCNGRKSIDGMPSILSSIPMFVSPFFVSPYSVNNVSGLADCLGGKGYETAFFHGAERGSMGFMAFARATKFKNYYGREDYNADKRTGGDADFDGWWGISDEPFLQYMCTKLSETRQPFMTSVFTLSSHHPFRVPDKYKELFKEEEMPIHKSIRYTDNALRRFFDEARRQPWFGNTIFAITSDHTNMSNHAEYKTDLGGFCSPVIFYDPSGEIKPEMRDAVAQQIDIMPTILSYLGYDEPYFAFGIDLLQTPAEETWAVNYLNGVYQYVKYGYVIQFDGTRTTAVYSLEDRMMKNNIAGRIGKRQDSMERELKAIIQQYMERMTGNRLLPEQEAR